MKIIRELLAHQSFETLGDLADALKIRCGKLNLLATDDAISDALRVVGSNTPLVQPKPATEPQVVPFEAPVIGRGEAASILKRLQVRVADGRLAVQPDDDDDVPRLIECL